MTTQEARAQAQHLYFAAQSKDGSCDLEQFTGILLNLLRIQDRDTRHACAEKILTSENDYHEMAGQFAHPISAAASMRAHDICINMRKACP